MIPLEFPSPGRWPSIAFRISSHKQASHIRQQKAKQSGSTISGIKGSKRRHLSIGSFSPNIVTKASSIIPLLSLSCGPCLPSRVPRYHSYSHSLEVDELLPGASVRNSTRDKVMRQSSDGKANQTSGFPPGIS